MCEHPAPLLVGAPFHAPFGSNSFIHFFVSPTHPPSFLLSSSSLPFLFFSSLHLIPQPSIQSTMCNKSGASANPDRVVLPTNVTPSHYTVTITPDLKAFTFGGYVEIE